jgi:hypothetical protein
MQRLASSRHVACRPRDVLVTSVAAAGAVTPLSSPPATTTRPMYPSLRRSGDVARARRCRDHGDRSDDEITGDTTVTTGPAILIPLAITPSPASMIAGDTLPLTATGT